jgi:pimeloyl-ACP methyl ester carboxylesterase
MTKRLSGWPAVVDTHLEVGGRQVRVLRAGGSRRQGDEPQLLVHGLGGSSVTWVEVVEGLAEHGPVVAVDLPGFGGTRPSPGDSLTVSGYVEFLIQVADALGWGRFNVHGNSMGGLVSTILAARHPTRVERLVLVSPALPPRSPARLLLPARATIDGMLPIALSSMSAAALGAIGLAGPELSAQRNRALLKLIYPDPDGVDRRVLALMAGAIGRIQAPTLLLGGTRDALVPARTLRAVLARRPDWQGHLLDDRRHALMLEDPTSYLELVKRWREGTDRAA